MNSTRVFGSASLRNALALAILPPGYRLADGSGPRDDAISATVWKRALDEADDVLALARSRAVNVDRWASEAERTVLLGHNGNG